MKQPTELDATLHPRRKAVDTAATEGVTSNSVKRAFERARLALVMFVMTVFASPPLGILSGNEEAYFSAAAHAYGSGGLPPNSAVLGGMAHALAFSTVTGLAIDYLGFEGAQIALRLLVALLYAIAFTALFDRIGLGLAGAVTAIAAFLLLGQDIVGGEWLLNGAEPKTFAYPLVIGGLAFGLTGAIYVSALLLAAATWFHLLIGGYGLALMTAALLFVDRRPRALLKPLAIYVLAVAPLIIYLLAQSYGQTFSHSDGVSSSWISTFVRNPHHAMPFASRGSLATWLPGLVVTFALSVSFWWVAPQLARDERLCASIVVAASAWMLLAAVLVLLDRSGSVGVFLPFRVSSLALLFAMIVGALLLQGLHHPPWPRVATAIAFLLSALLLPSLAVEAAKHWAVERDARSERSELAEIVVSTTERSSVILVTSQAERHALWLERRTGRAAYVFFKFFPSEAPWVAEWYRRTQVRSKVENGECEAATADEYQYILATQRELPRLEVCGQQIAVSGRFVLLRRSTLNSESAAASP